MNSLVACKSQAEQVDGVLSNIGKRGNLNNFIKQFVAMDDAVKALRKELDSVKAGLGDKLNNGWMKSFDEMVAKMSQISELSKNIFEGLNGVNLKDKGVTKELRSYAEQLNAILKNVGIDKQIDLELFNTKDVQAQFDELIQYAGELNGKLNVTLGEIDLSKFGDNIKSAGDKVSGNIKEAGGKISAEVQQQIDELEKQKAKYQEALDIFSGKGTRVKTTKKNDVATLTNLVEEFKKAELELSSKEQGSSGYEEAFARKVKAATLLKNTADYVVDHGSNKGSEYVAMYSKEYEKAQQFLEKFSEKQKTILEKIKNDYKQKIQEINTEIAKFGKEVPETKNEPKNATISYEKLTKSVERYYELQRKLDTAADSNEFNKIADEADKIADSFSNMDSACSAVFDRIQDGLGKSEALSQLADILNIQPSGTEAGVKAAQEAADAAKKKADEEERAYQAITKSVETQRVMYHLGTGSAINGKGARSDTFADMLDNLTTNANGTRYEKYGYGVLGGGLFGVQNPSTIPKEQAASAGKFIYSLDLSKYNMYLLDTEERAANLMDFMSKLQKIAIRGAVPDYTGFNEFLGNTDLNSLYEQFKTLFDETKFTKEQLGSFIDEMVSQLTQAGLFFDSEKGQLDFHNISDELANSDNISTRFFKKLGYQGVNAGNTSLDGFGQGSVLFDFNQSDIVGYFNTIEQAAQDFQNNLKSGWVGSNEQLQQYLANIEEIIAKISTAKQNKLQLMPNFDTSNYDNTLALLNNVKQNISNILSNNATESASSSFAIVTDNQTAQLEKEKQLMQEIAALKEKLNAVPTNPVDASELESAQKQVQELEEEILRMEGALDSWKSSYYEIQQSLDYSIPMSEVEENMTSNDVVDEYRAQIETLNSTINQLNEKLATTKTRLTDIQTVDSSSNVGDASLKEIDSKIQSYEELCEVVKRYNELVLKSHSENLTDTENKEIDKINSQFAATKGVLNDPDKYVNYDISMSRMRGFLGEYNTDQLAQYLGIEVPHAASSAGASIDNLKTKAEDLKTKFLELTQSLDSDLFAGHYDEFSLGKSQAELDKAQQELQELADAGYIAADAMEQVNSAYKNTSNAITASYEGIKNENMFKEDSGSYDRGYEEGYFAAEKRYEQDVNSYIHEINELTKRSESLESQLSQMQSTKNQVSESTSITTPEIDSANKAKEAFAAATTQKNQFVEANVKVKESAESSAIAIDKEVQKVREASEAFADAASKKNDFANANKNVKDTEESTKKESKSKKPSSNGYQDLDTYKTLIDANKKLSSAFNKIDTEVFVDKNTELGQLKTRYEELTKEIQELTKSEETLGKVSEEDMQRLSTATKQLMSDFEKYAQAKKEASKQKDSTYGADVLEKVQSQHTRLIDKVDSGGYSNASGIVNKLQQYEQAYQRIIDLQKKLANTDITSDLGKKIAAEFDDAVKSFNNYGKKIENIIKKSENLQDKIGNIPYAVSEGFDLEDEASRRSELEAFARSFDGLDKKSIQFSDSYSKVVFTIKNGNGEIEKITASFNQAGTAIDASSKNLGKVANKFTSFFDGVKKKTGEIATYFTGANLVYRAATQIRQGITYVKEIDTALTELKKVTDETDATYKKFLKTASQTAGQIGSTVKDFTNATADFARLGYNIEQASDLAKAASVYYNVGDDLADIGEASDSIISTMHGFGIEASNAMEIVDKFNEVGNNFAISSSGIGQSLLRSASAMAEAGNTIDETIGLITAANSVVQNPEAVGTAMKTLSLRIRGAKVELEDAGEDVDGMANSISELQKKLLALTGGKVNIMLDEKTFKNTTEILREMSTVWDDMTDVNRASALELLGGKRQANVLAAVIKNFDLVENAIKASSDAAGSAERENEKYLNSIQGKVDQFNNAAQTMWMNFISSDAIKFVVDLGTNLVKIADDLGLVGTALAALGIKTVLPKIFSGFKDSIGAAKTAFDTARGIVSTISSFNGEGLMSFLGGKIEATSINDITHALGAEIMAQKELSKELATQILLKNGVKAEDIEGALAAMGYSSANGVLSLSFKGLATSIKEAAIAFWASPFGKIAIIVGAITAIVAIMSALIDTHDDYVDELKETSNEISDVRNNIQSLNSELKTTQDRIDELNKKDKLSFAEEEELKNLKAQNAELERSIRLAEQKEKRLQKKASKSLNKAVKSDALFNNITWTRYANSKGEHVRAAEAIDSSTQYAEGTYGLKEGYTQETVTDTALQRKIEQYKLAQEALKQAKDELEKLGDDAEDKEVKSAEKKVEQMQKNVDTTYDAISDTMDKINEDYLSQEGVEWQYGDPDELEDWQKQMNANLKIIYDAQDKLAIASDTTGKAIESAFSRVSLQTEFQDELKTIQETAGITGEKLKEMYDSSNDTSDTGIKAFIQSLIDCGVIANTSADELQKVVDLSLQLGGNTSEAAVANQKLARSQKRLQYYKQYKELNEYVNSLKKAGKNASNLTNEQKKLISSMSQNLQALAKEIDAYDILGAQIEEAKQAFEDFEKAKESDENTDYASTAGEMLQTVIEGFQSAEMGTEAFKSAFTGLIPESVYKDLDTLEEKYTAVAQYISEDLSKYFTIKYDDEGALESVEVTTKNIETFMDEAQSKGLATFENGQWTILENDFKKFASEIGITTSALVAFGEQADKLDADWIMGDYSSFFDIFDMDTESNIDKITRSLANLDLQLLNGKINVNDYVQEYAKLQNELSSEKANAVSDIVEYDNTTKEIDSLKTQLQEATNKLNELKTKGAPEDQIANAANEASEIAKNLEEAIKKKADLCQPSEMLVEVALENIQATKDRITAELGKIDANLQLTTTDKDGNEQINSSIIKQLDDGTYTINVDANLSEEAKAKVQEYVDALNSEIQVNQYVAGTQDATTDAENLKQTYNDLSEVIENLPDVRISTLVAQGAVYALKKRVDKLKKAIDDLPKDVTITTTNINRTVTTGGGGISASGTFSSGNAHFDGAANASGTLGAEKTSTSLVGELGPELRVRGNRWELLGENGAEFANVKKGDIIFNHKQTKQLLENGYINSRGKAYANGTGGTSITKGTSIDYEKCIKLLDQYEKDVAQATKESNEYIAKLDDRYKKYGNIDNVNRDIVFWNDESIDKYSTYIDSMANLYSTSAKEFADDLRGSWSTVLGASDRFRFDGQSVEVAYSQMLNDGNETKLLTFEELENYMWDLMQRSTVNGNLDPNKMIELDSVGIVEDIQGEMILVKDLLAGVEGQLVDGIKLSREDIQTMSGDLANSSSIYNGFSMHDIQENTLWKDAVAHYGMGGDAFTALESEANSYGLTLDELMTKIKAYRTEMQDPLQQDVNIGANVDIEGIAQKVYTAFSNIFSTISSWFSNLFSGGKSNNGEDGASHAFGSDGLTNNETGSLIGELGTEMLVRNGKWQTIGENGAEMMNLKRGDIIFNHKQTEALLKHGYVNSRGKAFAAGNAHAGIRGTIFTKYATVSGYGGTVPDWFGHSNILGDLGSAADSVSDASGAVKDATDDVKQTIDFIEYRLEEIENSITNMTNRVENFLDDTSQTKEKNRLYEGLIDAEKQKASTYLAAAETYNKKAAQLLSKVPAKYQEMAKNGAIAIKDFVGESQGEIADAIEEYRTWSTKAEDAENDYLASIAEISAKRLEQLQDIADDFENIIGLTERQSGILQGEIDLLEESGERLSENFYKELMKDSQKQISDLNKKRASLQDILNQAVKSGDVKVGSDDWYEMVNTIYDVDDAILECKKDIEGFQNSINDLYWDNLDKLIDKIDNVDSELSHLYNLVSDEEKVVDEFGNWTKDGVTALGLLAQQLEVENFKVDQYGEAIARLEKDYAAGLYSTDEYNEKLAELKENQWDAIEAQESAKKSIIDLNKTRIQAVKDGMQKEIDAFSELIDKKKEELSLQKEAHDFSKQVAEQQKNIADIEKRLAVIAGDNSASAIAQKKKLQAELAQAKEELDELYYGHSIDKQQEALDKQLEDYQNNKQDEMDALDESLKNENQIIQDSYATVAANTELLAQNLSDIASNYGITLSDSVTKPWLDGANAIGTYQDQLDTSTSSFTDQLKLIKQELVDLQVEADNTANSIINATNRKKDKTESAKYTPPKPSPQKDPPKAPKPKTPSPPSKGSSVTIKKSAKNFSRNGGNGTRMQSWVPGSTFTVYQVSGSEVLIGRSGGYTGWVKLSDIEGYASGAKSINKDQFAFLDELGEELQLVPDGAGRLSYVKKGTGIIPADLTERLMEWGQLDPSSVLEQSRPTVSAPHVINNNIELNMQVGEVVHIDRADNSSIPNITKAVQDQMDNYMKNINKKLYNRVR